MLEITKKVRSDNQQIACLEHEFLLRVGVLLHRYGTPAYRIERVMTQISESLGIQGAFLYTPTALIFSLVDDYGESTYVRRVDSGAIDVDKLIRFDEVLEQVEDGQLDLEAAGRELDQISTAKAPFPSWLGTAACGISCAAVAVFFRGTAVEVLVAGLIGLCVSLLEILPQKLKWDAGLLEPVAGFFAAASALGIASFFPLDDRLVTLASLIVIVPGLTITVALTEIAVGHLSAGVARLAGACTSLLTLTIGVALGWRLMGAMRDIPEQPMFPLDAAWQWLAIVIAPICFAIVFRARWPQWPVIVAVSVAGFSASMAIGNQFGVEFGAFTGALVVGGGSNLYARLRDRPALVPLTPGIIVLVPGSLGYRSLTSFLEHQTLAGVDFAFGMVIVAAALVGGILVANVVVPPKRIL
ncbi:MAG: threonine/serine exporter family protein [Planctomycetota bacterium]